MYWADKKWAETLLSQHKMLPIGYIDRKLQNRFEYVLKVCKPFINSGLKYGLLYVYLFDRFVQRKEFRYLDGVCTTFHPEEVSTIGINIGAFDSGYNYAAWVLLHELVHLKYNGHGDDFAAALDSLIVRFNEKAGKHLPRSGSAYYAK